MRNEFNELFLELIGNVHQITFEVRRDLKPEYLTQIQYNIMEYLFMHDGVSMGPLAECLYLSLPNASREVKKLVQLELLYKKSSESDKRVTNIFLTDTGRQLMTESFSKIMTGINERYSDLTDDELKTLAQCIRLLKDKLFDDA